METECLRFERRLLHVNHFQSTSNQSYLTDEFHTTNKLQNNTNCHLISADMSATTKENFGSKRLEEIENIAAIAHSTDGQFLSHTLVNKHFKNLHRSIDPYTLPHPSVRTHWLCI